MPARQTAPFKLLRSALRATIFATVATHAQSTSTSNPNQPQIVQIDRAATLTVPFDNLARQLPQLDARQRSAGSRFLIHSDVDLNQPVDVLALADIQLFEQPSSPAQTKRFPWWVTFASNEIGVAYTPKSHSADRITPESWFQVLLDPAVQTAYADPELDPEGYNTLLAWKLAESHYRQPNLAQRLSDRIPQKNIRPDSTQLLALLSAGEVDYAWEYRSVAEQHHLKFLRLPKEINLSDPGLAQTYKTACIDLHHTGPNGEKQVQPKCGQPILYAAAIPTDAPHPQAAETFLKALISRPGQTALTAASQQSIRAKIGGNAAAAPGWLNEFAK